MKRMQDERKKGFLINCLKVNTRNEFVYNNIQLDGYLRIFVTILTNF